MQTRLVQQPRIVEYERPKMVPGRMVRAYAGPTQTLGMSMMQPNAMGMSMMQPNIMDTGSFGGYPAYPGYPTMGFPGVSAPGPIAGSIPPGGRI